VQRLVAGWIDRLGGEVHGQSGILLSARLVGAALASTLMLRYRSHAGGEYEADWPLWGEQAAIAIPGGPAVFEPPAALLAVIAANWLDGSIHADEDPYWAAVERQRQAVIRWREAFPEADAACPPSITDAERARAAWREWHERFPEAGARWSQIGRVEDYLA
jgi:hypothetical protein